MMISGGLDASRPPGALLSVTCMLDPQCLTHPFFLFCFSSGMRFYSCVFSFCPGWHRLILIVYQFTILMISVSMSSYTSPLACFYSCCVCLGL